MRNPLIDAFPTALEVCGTAYPIHTDFRTALTILLAYEDAGLTDCERAKILYDLLYAEDGPPDYIEGCKKAVLFLDCGKPAPEQDTEGRPAPQRLYSFDRDAPYIFSAFREAYGIDLEHESMHWWKFCYLLGDLPEDCVFKQLVALRRRRASGKLTREEKQLWYEMEDILELPQPVDAEQARAEYEFNRALGIT